MKLAKTSCHFFCLHTSTWRKYTGQKFFSFMSRNFSEKPQCWRGCARAGRSLQEVNQFFGYPKSFVYSIKKEYLEADDTEEVTADRKAHRCRPNAKRKEEFIASLQEKINDGPGQSMSKLALKMGVSNSTIQKSVHEPSALLRWKKFVQNSKALWGSGGCTYNDALQEFSLCHSLGDGE